MLVRYSIGRARRAAMLAALATAAVAGASECADAYDENCLPSRCCQDEGYRCFKRDGVEYAQCRRYAEPCTTQNDVWLCPEEWCPGCWDSAATLPSRPPSPPLPPAPPPAPPPPPPDEDDAWSDGSLEAADDFVAKKPRLG